MTSITSSKTNDAVLYTLLALLLAAFSFLTVSMGETPWEHVWNGAMQRLNGENMHWNPLLDERIPRLIVILCTGSSLAVSGAILQSLFHNPLASPSVLGISCGGTLLVVLMFVSELHLAFPYAIPIAAVAGCLATLLIVYALSRHRGHVQMTTLILTGIAVSTFLIAMQGAIVYALRDRWHLIQTLTEWEAGTTADRSWKHVHMQLPLTLIGLAGCWFYRKEIDILTLGEEEAKNLGVEVSQVRWRLFLCVSLLTGGSIAAIGNIAFFGLVLPHLIRRLFGPENNRLIPLCIIIGSISLAGMDLLLRYLDIQAFSIGNVSAVLGGLFFIALILWSRSCKKTLGIME